MKGLYNDHPLLDEVKATFGIRTDAELARHMEVRSSTVSRMRSGQHVSDETVLILHDLTGWSIAKLKELRDKSEFNHTGEGNGNSKDQSSSHDSAGKAVAG